MDNDKEFKEPKWIEDFVFLVYNHWGYHSPCTHINIQSTFVKKGKYWEIKAAPIFQEVYGGDDDGKKIWAGFAFDFTSFSGENGIWIIDQVISSYCSECSNYPYVSVRGKFKGHRFVLQILLEPVSEEVVEVIDTLSNSIRDVPIKQEES